MLSKEMQWRIKNAISQNKFIRTPRLFLMPLAVSDATEMFKWAGDPEVNHFMSYAIYHNVDEVKAWLANRKEYLGTFGFFLQDGQLIGCGDVGMDHTGQHSMGYNLAKVYWGNGYCTEACKAMLAHAVEVLGVHDFTCGPATANLRSQRVVEKCGFTFQYFDSYEKSDGSQTFESKEYSLHVDLHQMNLDDEPFCQIANGHKTIELRLDDERRQNLKIGDYITFTNNQSSEKIVAKIKALHKFPNFAELYKSLDLTKCGYSPDQLATASPQDMLKYYPAEKQAQYGVLGIEIQLLCMLG